MIGAAFLIGLIVLFSKNNWKWDKNLPIQSG